MSATEEILGQLPVNDIAAELGVEPAQVEAAARQAVPALLHGLSANAEDPAGAASLEQAVGEHQPLSGPVVFSDIDPADGQKIVGHVFGGNTDQVVGRLAGTEQFAGLDSALAKKLLSYLAPIVLSYLAGQVAKKMGGGVLGSILEDVLGGQAKGRKDAKAGQGGLGGVLGDLLGGLLGGGRR